MNNNFQINLSWEDPTTGERKEPQLTLPIAFGREFVKMPVEIEGHRVSRMLLKDKEVSRFHALINLEGNKLVVIDQGSPNGVFVNNERHQHRILSSGDILKIGPYTITVNFAPIPVSEENSSILRTNLLQKHETHFLSITDVFPLFSKKLDLHQNGFLVPGIFTVIFVVAMLVARNINQFLFLYILAIYLAGVSHYFIHKLCHRHKPWWLLVSLTLATAIPLLAGTFHPLKAHEGDNIPVIFIKTFVGNGLSEELFKAFPVLLVYWLARLLPSPHRSRIGISEPIDGILLGTAAATGFALVETMMHVHEVVGHNSDFFGAITLLIPQILGDISGQVAYSGYFGYFIGLSALKSSKRWRILGIGYLTSSAIHTLWALVIIFQEQYKAHTFVSISLAVLGATIGSVAYAFLMSAILKARHFSPKY
ncbi:MAG: PrsW family intramembrane metalloprotease [Scytonematopsis contorta HA4267-MV1]|jgi:RsiW-degrading membrane proteinase PrsW (M82 family)|nr:PrsW family intramembrane metalloprotease [Scytonematopsis contorta HA4267-MV1]